MKRIVLAFALLFALVLASHAKKVEKETMEFRYEVSDYNASSKQGTYAFKIWTYAKKEDQAVAQSLKNAVHAVVFMGVGGQKAMYPGDLADHEDFFREFFKNGGDFQRFVSYSGNASIAPGDSQKVGGEHKVGVKVIVKKDDLRKYLETKGIIKSLNSLF